MFPRRVVFLETTSFSACWVALLSVTWGENRRHSHPFVGNLKLGKMGSVPNDRYRVQIVVCCSSSFKNSNSLFDISKNLMRLLLKESEAFMKSYLRIV